MSIIYMQSTIDNFITKNRVSEVTGDPEVVELTDDKDRVISKYYKFDKQVKTNNNMKKVLAIIILGIFLTSCGSSHCTTKSTNRGGGYYINR